RDLDESVERLADVFARQFNHLIFLYRDTLARTIFKLDNDRFAFFPDETSDGSLSLGYAGGDSIPIFIGCIET
ncbi:MAG: hypothetical protein P8M81_00825, partial [Litorivicinaceae bacterium]|nr:hypothetical protein [Litorivicinaceae bacterium]